MRPTFTKFHASLFLVSFIHAVWALRLPFRAWHRFQPWSREGVKTLTMPSGRKWLFIWFPGGGCWAQSGQLCRRPSPSALVTLEAQFQHVHHCLLKCPGRAQRTHCLSNFCRSPPLAVRTQHTPACLKEAKSSFCLPESMKTPSVETTVRGICLQLRKGKTLLFCLKTHLETRPGNLPVKVNARKAHSAGILRSEC